MTPEEWERVEELFNAAVELPPLLRANYLNSVAGNDTALRAEVETLLHAHDDEPEFLAEPGWTSVVVPDVPPNVGPYRIVRLLGRGGMGQVFLAERVVQDVTLQVALKVMRRGLDTDDFISRFRTERQILASLDHPNIARLLDVGSTETGAPYLVMEYVDGKSLLADAEARRLTLDERLASVQTLCTAVQHAHRRLVVHRDIKPGNILVTVDGVPKLLDFGVAKLMSAESGSGANTDVHSRMLTPSYAAPEQLRGEPVTTACDVYALGVLMYELLTGQHPFADSETTREVIQQRVLDGDALPPSRRVTDTAGSASNNLGTTVESILRGDLDTIVLKAMHRDADQRYASPAALEDDITRFRTGRPILARPSSAWYRASKFIKRNKAAVAVTALLLITLLSASVITAYQSRRIQQESVRVAHERDKALEVRNFLLEMFGTTGPDQAAGDSVTARALLDRRAASLARNSADGTPTSMDAHSEMLSVLAEGYEKLGLLSDAEPLARRALQQRQQQLGSENADVMSSHNQLGWILHQRRMLPDAEAELRRAVAIGRVLFADTGDTRLARALNDLGVTREARGDYTEAAALYRESLAMRRNTRGDALGTAITTSNLSVVLYRNGEIPAAIAAGESALKQLQASVGDDHARTTIVQSNLASMQSALGNHQAAAAQHHAIIARRIRLFGAAHPSVASSLTLLANELAADTATIAGADSLLERALVIQRGPDGNSDDQALTLRVRGDVERKTGRYEAAMRDYQAALELTKRTVGPSHERVAVLLARTAETLAAQGDTARARENQQAAVQTAIRSLGPKHKRTLELEAALARYSAALPLRR